MATRIPRSHPRYHSLVTRERLRESLERGLLHETGLIAHGRGEAFDYLLGERTTPPARRAIRAAAAALLLGHRPVLSANGNVVALAAEHLVRLSRAIPAPIEVNLFHRTPARVRRLERELRRAGARHVITGPPDARIPRLSSHRARCHRRGIYSADVVLVPLEDGDRARALKQMGKKVLAIDLNPLSRTSRTADVTIVDELTRALPLLIRTVRALRRARASSTSLSRIFDAFENRSNLRRTRAFMARLVSSTRAQGGERSTRVPTKLK